MSDNPYEDRPFHAHWASESRDCDGLYHREGVYRQFSDDPDQEYQFEWEDDLAFLDVLVVWAYKLPDWDVSELEISHADFGYSISSFRQTDEGFDRASVWMCQIPTCDFGHARFRDHTAEAAGY